jgi:hypothetical protein
MNTIQSRRRFLGVPSAGAAAAIAPTAVAAAVTPGAETLLSAPAPAVAAAAAPKEPYLDEKLFNLINEYLAAEDERQQLEDVLDRASKELEAKHPMPDVLLVRPEDHELELPDHHGYYDGLFFDGGNRSDYHDGMWIDALRRPLWKRLVEYTPPKLEPICQCEGFDPSPAARARADEIVAAYDEWWPKVHRRVRRRTGYTIEARLPPGFRAVDSRHERLTHLLSRLEAKINKARARTFPGLLAKAKIASMAAADPDDDPAIGSVLRDMLAMGDWMGWPPLHVNGKVFQSRGRA